MGRRSERPTCGIVAAAVAAALAACALLLPSCASGEATVLPLAGGEAAVSEDGAAAPRSILLIISVERSTRTVSSACVRRLAVR